MMYPSPSRIRKSGRPTTSLENLIPRVLWPVACPDHIMAEGDESVFRTSPDAGVEEKLHSASEVTSGSIRSWATSLWA